MKTQLKTRLKAARLAAGYKSLSSMCEEHHLHKSNYSQHESGSVAPREQVLKKYCELFDVNFEWLKDGAGLPYDDVISDNNKSHKILNEVEILQESIRSAAQPLAEPLLLAIIKETLKHLEHTAKQPSPDEVAEIIVGIYKDIVTSEADPEIQELMVLPAVSASIRFV